MGLLKQGILMNDAIWNKTKPRSYTDEQLAQDFLKSLFGNRKPKSTTRQGGSEGSSGNTNTPSATSLQQDRTRQIFDTPATPEFVDPAALEEQQRKQLSALSPQLNNPQLLEFMNRIPETRDLEYLFKNNDPRITAPQGERTRELFGTSAPETLGNQLFAKNPKQTPTNLKTISNKERPRMLLAAKQLLREGKISYDDAKGSGGTLNDKLLIAYLKHVEAQRQ
jgi:hypothetical protein